jgi:hypothetical protein
MVPIEEGYTDSVGDDVGTGEGASVLMMSFVVGFDSMEEGMDGRWWIR